VTVYPEHPIGAPLARGLAEVIERPLAEWERKLLEKARQLRAGGKSAMLAVKFDGQTVTFWRVLPDGRVE